MPEALRVRVTTSLSRVPAWQHRFIRNPVIPLGSFVAAANVDTLARSRSLAPNSVFSLKRIEQFTNEATFPLRHSPTLRMELKPGDYAIFAQTRSVMQGWPKSEHDAYDAVSDLVVTSSNILHITILPDGADPNSGRP